MTTVLINTRPSERTRFALKEIDVIDLPLIELDAFDNKTLSDDDKTAMTLFMQGKFRVVVVVSITAVHCAMRFLKSQGIHHASDLTLQNMPVFIAVGQATQNALAEFGFCALTPDTMNNEGMLAMPQICQLNPKDKVLIWRGVNGRRLLHNSLVARGITVTAIAWYDRRPIKNIAHTYQNIINTLQPNTPIFVLITSQLALETWATLLHHRPLVYLTLGERLWHFTKAQFASATVLPLDTLEPNHIRRVILDHIEPTK